MPESWRETLRRAVLRGLHISRRRDRLPDREKDDYGFTRPPLRSLIQFHEDAIGFFKPSKVVGIGINSVGLSVEESKQAMLKIEHETGLPTIDAFRFGGEKLADAVERFFCT